MGVKTTVGQVALRGGSRDAQAHGILADERATRLSRGRSRGNLYVIVEVGGAIRDRDVRERELAEIVRDVYYAQRGSVTAGLQQALRRVNTTIFTENRDSLPGERRTAGISCAVLRHDDLFIAQAGPTAIFIERDGQVERYPDVSPWLDGVPREEVDAWALGERHDINIALAHTTVRQGDTILLTGDVLPRLVAPQAWRDLLSRRPIEATLEGLLSEAHGSDLSALVVHIGQEPASEDTLDRLPAHVPTAPVHETPPGPVPTPRAVQAGQDGGVVQRIGDTGQRLAAATSDTLRAASAAVGGGIKTLLARMVPARGTSPTSSAGAAPATAAAAPPSKREATRPSGPSDQVQKALIAVALLIPLIIAVIVVTTLLRRGHAVRSELDALWAQAQAQWQEAETTTDPALSRTYLTGAEQALDDLIAREPDYPGATNLRQSIRTRLDVINNVQRITWSGILNSYPTNADLSRVIVQGVHVFVMDRQNGKVYYHRLDQALGRTLDPDTRETVLVQRGMQVGSVLVGDMVDMTWMPIGPSRQKASLVILESGGSLLDYDPATGQLVPLKVSSTDAWQFPALVGGHSGRFYVLDSNANQIWRYAPTPDGYAVPPDEWLQEPVDLAGVIDISIGDSIYLLYADGSILKLTTGLPDTFQLTGWDVPPANPTALFTRPPDETQWLYLADRGNSRIVQASKEGVFKQQFRLGNTLAEENGDALAQVSSIFVDEIEGQAFVLSGQNLYLLVLPMSE
ncbi:MAG: hypothetical protein JXA93_12525 [Anaerolineae bacterium]|nr:hypothetical protein [Anaerolineae bacterium]